MMSPKAPAMNGALGFQETPKTGSPAGSWDTVSETEHLPESYVC